MARFIFAILILIPCIAAEDPWQLGNPIVFRASALLEFGQRQFDLRTEDGLRSFAAWSRNLEPYSSAPNQSPSERATEKRDSHGISLIRELAEHILSDSSTDHQILLRSELLELAQAIANNHRAAIPRYVDFIQTPLLLADALHHPVGRGTKPAANIPISADYGQIDPLPSSFWRPPAQIPAANLALCFDRAEIPDYSREIWTYAGPKKGGRNAGCELKFDGQHIKIKFAEIHSEPFTARIFDTLGYNVLPTDFCAALKIKYDRRLFTEFNSRREMKMRAGVLFIPLYQLNLQEAFDPLNFIDHAALRDGSSITASHLRELLFKDSARKHPETDPDNFDPAVEERIDYLVTKEANVQTEPRDSQSIGPWDFGALGHENLRELRGAGLVAAWLGWWDSRFENTRLRVRKTADGLELKHYLSDLGGGLGIAGGTFHHSDAKAERFEESFTRRAKNGRFEIIGYEPVDDTPAFRAMTENDARWMARKIAQISETQISAALAASGFSNLEVQEFTRKLIARRTALLRDLQINQAPNALVPAP